MLEILKQRQWHEEVIEDRWVNCWVEPAIAQCVCGEEVVLDQDAAQCPRCKRIYNLSGQELMPRQYWENDW